MRCGAVHCRRRVGDGHGAGAGLRLWVPDGYHPTRARAHLIACVFYALLAQRDPEASRYTAGLDSAQARWLQRIARESVLRLYRRLAPLAFRVTTLSGAILARS
jgi:hypothetical protein